jgi:hypothetical protein
MLRSTPPLKYLLTLVLAAALLSCASPTASTGVSSPSGRDGSSAAKAIVVPETGEMTGVAYEYEYIRSHYPGAQPIMQALAVEGNKAYDLITFKTRDGKQHTIYFDIHRFFGRF